MYPTPAMSRFACFFLLTRLALAVEPCRIEIIDKENGWPVPLVELSSTHEMRHVSDNLGLITSFAAIQAALFLGLLGPAGFVGSTGWSLPPRTLSRTGRNACVTIHINCVSTSSL